MYEFSDFKSVKNERHIQRPDGTFESCDLQVLERGAVLEFVTEKGAFKFVKAEEG